jgi:glycosyltransferase involved in cell wall biosynthesis
MQNPLNRIAIVHPSFVDIGGAELQVVAQARLMQKLGLTPEVYAFNWSPKIWSRDFDSISLRARSEDRAKGSSEVRSADQSWLQAELAGCRSIIAHNPPATLAVAQLEHDGPKIWYCHEPPRWLHVETANPYLRAHVREAQGLVFSGFRHFVLHRLLPMNSSRLFHGSKERQRREDLRSVSRFTVVWANSEFTRDLVRATYGPVPVEVLYPAIPQIEAPARQGLKRDRLRIVCMTRLEPVKNVDGLILAVAALRKRAVHVSLDIIGLGRADRYLRALTRFLDLADVVTFHGRVHSTQLAKLVASCDVFALVPFDEPFGMAFAEAMSWGLLVVAPNHGGPREIVDDSKLGFVADPLSVVSISEALERAFSLSDTAADRLRASAAKAAQARFSEPVIQERMHVLLRQAGVMQN